jgi:hypothetical protein
LHNEILHSKSLKPVICDDIADPGGHVIRWDQVREGVGAIGRNDPSIVCTYE